MRPAALKHSNAAANRGAPIQNATITAWPPTATANPEARSPVCERAARGPATLASSDHCEYSSCVMPITNARTAPTAAGDEREIRIALGANHMEVRAVRSGIRRASNPSERVLVLANWKAVMSTPLQMNASNAYTPAWITMPARDGAWAREDRATDQTIQPVVAKLANWAN